MSLISPNVGTTPVPGKVDENDLAAEYRKTIVEIQSQLFDKASTYSNLIMVGGYAGAFTVWGNVKAQLPANANMSVALCLGVSLSIFIFYQVFKMAAHVRHFRKVRALLSEELSLPDFFQKYNDLDLQSRKATLRSGVFVSTFCFVACVAPALIALAILFYNFCAALIGFPMWPGGSAVTA